MRFIHPPLGRRLACCAAALAAAAAPLEAQRGDTALPRLVVQTGHVDDVEDLSLQPGGGLLASADDQAIRIWDARSGRELRAIPIRKGMAAGPSRVAIRADSQAVAGTDSGRVRAWDPGSGRVLYDAAAGYRIMDLAFTDDGRRLVVAADSNPYGIERTAKHYLFVHDAATGALVRRVSLPMRIHAIAVHPGGRLVAGAGMDGVVRVWDLARESDEPAAVLRGHRGQVLRVAFSPGGKLLASAAADGAIRLWSTETWASALELPRAYVTDLPYAAPLAFTASGRVIVSASLRHDGGLTAWSTDGGTVIFDGDVDDGASRVDELAGSADALAVARGTDLTVVDFAARETRGLRAAADWVQEVTISADGRDLFLEQRSPRRWDLRTGQLVPWSDSSYDASSIAVSAAAGRAVLGEGHALRALDLRTGRTLWRQSVVEGRLYAIGASSVSMDSAGRRVVSNWGDETVHVLDGATGQELGTFAGVARGQIVAWTAISRDGARVAVIGHSESWEERHPVRIFRLAERDGAVTATLEGELGDYDKLVSQGVARGAFSPDGRRFVSISGLFALGADGAWRRVLDSASVGDPPYAFSADGRLIASRLGMNDVGIRDAATGALLHTLAGHTEYIEALAFTPDGRHLVSGSRDRTTRVWRVADGAELARLVALDDDAWVVVSPDGRFDTSDLEAALPLHWVMPDEPLRALPLEIFMRDYYEPRLLARLMSGERLPKLRSMGEVNRVQPEVAATAVKLEPGDSTATVRVTVRQERRAVAGAPRASGARDLHLFRDGQLVALAEGDLLRRGDSATLTFGGIRVPRGDTGRDSLRVSAYAFNTDGVKSATARAAVPLPATLPRRRGRAYVMSMGVNVYSDPAWTLEFAANDAAEFQRIVGERLRATGRYDDVVLVPLVSSADAALRTDARKETLHAVLDLLAGRPVPAALRARIPNAERLRAATPEDLVLVSVSSHGYTADDGVFYILPQDIGPGAGAERTVSPALLRHAVSSDELSLWLRAVDAGEMVLVVDACHSASAVEGAGFKPGPMGSRGLGQLAFDKGMRVLAASQAAEVALESNLLRQGLLTYALLHDGLVAGRADAKPGDGVITVGEWLRYAAERVPALYEELRTGTLQEARGFGVSAAGRTRPALQQPALFDFKRSRVERVVAGP